MENKFKVGDMVKLNPNKKYYCYGQSVVEKGEIGRITSATDDEYIVDFPSQEDWSGQGDDCVLANVVKTINDLQFADILTLRNGERYVVVDGEMQGENSSYSRDDSTISVWYNDDLTQNEDNKDEDIVKVERAGQVIYERQDVLEVTMEEVCKKFGQEVKIVKGDK